MRPKRLFLPMVHKTRTSWLGPSPLMCCGGQPSSAPTIDRWLSTSAGHPFRSAQGFKNVTFRVCQPPTHLAYLLDLRRHRRSKFSVLREDKDKMHWIFLSKRQGETRRGLGRLQGGWWRERERHLPPPRASESQPPAPGRLCLGDWPTSFTLRHNIERKASKNHLSLQPEPPQTSHWDPGAKQLAGGDDVPGPVCLRWFRVALFTWGPDSPRESRGGQMAQWGTGSCFTPGEAGGSLPSLRLFPNRPERGLSGRAGPAPLPSPRGALRPEERLVGGRAGGSRNRLRTPGTGSPPDRTLALQHPAPPPACGQPRPGRCGRRPSPLGERGAARVSAPARAPAALGAAGRAPPPGLSRTPSRVTCANGRPASGAATRNRTRAGAGSDCAGPAPARMRRGAVSADSGASSAAVGPDPLEGAGLGARSLGPACHVSERPSRGWWLGGRSLSSASLRERCGTGGAGGASWQRGRTLLVRWGRRAVCGSEGSGRGCAGPTRASEPLPQPCPTRPPRPPATEQWAAPPRPRLPRSSHGSPHWDLAPWDPCFNSCARDLLRLTRFMRQPGTRTMLHLKKSSRIT